MKYEKGNKIFLADTLSRAFIPADDQDESEFETINMIKYLPVSSIHRSSETLKRRDESLHEVLKAVIMKGWPEHKSNLPSIISPYFNMRDEMSIQDGLILKRERVVVLRASRTKLLKRIHSSHIGVNSCLNRVHECVFMCHVAHVLTMLQPARPVENMNSLNKGNDDVL